MGWCPCYWSGPCLLGKLTTGRWHWPLVTKRCRADPPDTPIVFPNMLCPWISSARFYAHFELLSYFVHFYGTLTLSKRGKQLLQLWVRQKRWLQWPTSDIQAFPLRKLTSIFWWSICQLSCQRSSKRTGKTLSSWDMFCICLCPYLTPLLKQTKTQRLAYSSLFKETTHIFDYIKAHPAYSDKEVI